MNIKNSGENPQKISGGKKMAIDLAFQKITDQNIRPCLQQALKIAAAEPKDITEIELCGNEFSDLSWLTDYTNLRVLNLNCTAVSDLSILQKQDFTPNFNSLEKLYLEITNVRDITPIQCYSCLKELSLLDLEEVKDQLSSVLPKLSGLEMLDLTNVGISDLSPILALQNLKKLSLLGVDLSRDDILELKKLPFLEELTVDDDLTYWADKVLYEIKEAREKSQQPAHVQSLGMN